MTVLLVAGFMKGVARTNDSLGKTNSWSGTIANHDSAIALLRAGISSAIQSGSDTLICDAYMNIGERYSKMNDYGQSIAAYRSALPYCLSNEDTSNCYNHLGIAYFDLGDYVTASENFYRALLVAQRSQKAYTNLTGILANLGEVNFRLHQYETALSYYDRGLPYAALQQPKIRLANILLNKGELLIAMHRYREARSLLMRVIALSDTLGNQDIKDAANEIIGISYLETGAYKSALTYLEQATRPGPFRNSVMEVAPAFYIAEAYSALRNYPKAESVLFPALRDAAVGHRRLNSLKGYSTLSEIYKATGRYREAMECMDSIIALKDSMGSSEKVNAVNLMDFKYKTSEKDRIIAQNQLVIARQQRDISIRDMWLIAIVSGIALLVFLLAGAFWKLQYEQKRRAEQIKLIEQHKKIEVLNALVQGEENERSRIARELHDGIGGMLSAAMMRLSATLPGAASPNRVNAHAEALNILAEMGEEIRKTAHNLMPDVLLKQDLQDALRDYCNNVATGHVPKINFQSFGDFGSLSEPFKLNVYRIVQELLKNTVRHAHATQVLVQLVMDENIFTLTVEDNGLGFNPEGINNGLGLNNIKSRVANLDGHLSLDSSPGNGVSVFIEFDVRAFFA